MKPYDVASQVLITPLLCLNTRNAYLRRLKKEKKKKPTKEHRERAERPSWIDQSQLAECIREMGNCSSYESTATSTAKLILQDGELQEFAHPVKVSQVLRRIINPASSFICNADEIEYDDFVPALSEDEELQPGQIYFVMPTSKLRSRIQAEEMAALATKASLALTKNGQRRKEVVPVTFSGDDVRKCRLREEWLSGGGTVVAKRKGNCGGRRGREFSSKLSAIQE